MAEQAILYAGDTALSGAASYVAGLMSHWGWGFDYLPGDEPLEAVGVGEGRQLFVLSDYSAGMMTQEAQERLVDRVAKGAGLLMIGGWESFHGQGGDWGGTEVGHALPVNIATKDDRVNCDQPAFLVPDHEHPTTEGLPWGERPPTIGGFNLLEAKAGSDVVLEVLRFTAQQYGGEVRMDALSRHPLLVVGAHGEGRTAALGVDLAPHWVGGLVDWGVDRVTAQADGGWAIEVGQYYAQFVRQLLGWVGRLEE